MKQTKKNQKIVFLRKCNSGANLCHGAIFFQNRTRKINENVLKILSFDD